MKAILLIWFILLAALTMFGQAAPHSIDGEKEEGKELIGLRKPVKN